MTNLPIPQLSKAITGQKSPTFLEYLEQLSKKSDEELDQILADSQKEYEKYVKGLEESERTAAASKDKSVAGPSPGFKPYKVTKPKAKKPRKLPIEEVIARLSEVAEYDPEVRKKLEKIWYGP